MGCPTGLVTAVAAVFISPGALLTPAPKTTLFGRIPRAGGVERLAAISALFGARYSNRRSRYCTRRAALQGDLEAAPAAGPPASHTAEHVHVQLLEGS